MSRKIMCSIVVQRMSDERKVVKEEPYAALAHFIKNHQWRRQVWRPYPTDELPSIVLRHVPSQHMHCKLIWLSPSIKKKKKLAIKITLHHLT